jgi:hypothetical protein
MKEIKCFGVESNHSVRMLNTHAIFNNVAIVMKKGRVTSIVVGGLSDMIKKGLTETNSMKELFCEK